MSKEMIAKQNKLKLKELEIIHCNTFEKACAVGKQADELGLAWADGECYLDKIRWTKYQEHTCYHLHTGCIGSSPQSYKWGYKVIKAAEWLSRHDIFLPHHKVYVSNIKLLPKGGGLSRYVGQSTETCGFICQGVTHNGETDKPKEWSYITSIYEPWEDLVVEDAVSVTVAVNGKQVSPNILSADSWANLREV